MDVAIEWYIGLVFTSVWVWCVTRMGFRWRRNSRKQPNRFTLTLVKVGVQLLEDRMQAEPKLSFYSGRPFQYGAAFRYANLHDFMRRTGPQKERIAMAAIMHPDGVIHAVSAPGRHHHCVRYMSAYARAGLTTTSKQGFITSHGRYVDRKTAFLIASAAGQIREKTNPKDVLFSEDMW
ncbi:hypothetical protein [Paraburkholderia sp. BCC1886]|uniref:hypothetical protein n=1 Tax=Paraburkholderia sp. BCC1886 TaxID=2562670 RepID=UPI001182AF5A|nr:hypothetical protein [Paraburkholderia sp. BCC1886]